MHCAWRRVICGLRPHDGTSAAAISLRHNLHAAGGCAEMTPCPKCACQLQRQPRSKKCLKCGGRLKFQTYPERCLVCSTCRETFPLIRGYACLNCGGLWNELPRIPA